MVETRTPSAVAVFGVQSLFFFFKAVLPFLQRIITICLFCYSAGAVWSFRNGDIQTCSMRWKKLLSRQIVMGFRPTPPFLGQPSRDVLIGNNIPICPMALDTSAPGTLQKYGRPHEKECWECAWKKNRSENQKWLWGIESRAKAIRKYSTFRPAAYRTWFEIGEIEGLRNLSEQLSLLRDFVRGRKGKKKTAQRIEFLYRDSSGPREAKVCYRNYDCGYLSRPLTCQLSWRVVIR